MKIEQHFADSVSNDVLHDPLNDASDSATASTKTAESGQPEKYQGDPMEHKDPAEQAQSAANELDNQMPWMIALLVNANKAYEAGRLETCLEICEDLLSNPYLERYMRVQTLQLMALLYPDSKHYLEEALGICDGMIAEGKRTLFMSELKNKCLEMRDNAPGLANKGG